MPSGIPGRSQATCHPEKLLQAKGLCKACYSKTQPKHIKTLKATCHPERVRVGKGLCNSCYWKQRHPKTRCKTPPTCHPERKHQAYGLCDQCYLKKWHKENKQKAKETQRKCINANPELYRLLRIKSQFKQYGITLEDYTRMYNAQEGKCQICKNTFKNQLLEGGHNCDRLVVDHSHKTGEARALLCGPCNRKLGILEQTEWKEKAESYLNSHKINTQNREAA